MMNLNACVASAATIQSADAPETRPFGIAGNADIGNLRATGRERHFVRDRQIYGEGDDADCAFQVVAGIVRTYKYLRDGRRQICNFHGPGKLFGLEIGQAYGLSAAAASDCTVTSYRRRTLERLAAIDIQLLHQLFSSALCGMARMKQHSITLGRRTAVERLAIFLVDCTEYSMVGNDILLAISRRDIADHLGLTIETVSRTLSELEERACIELSGPRCVHLIDIAGLRDLCE
jgi:CRP-like cAMP-binding protein